MSTDARITSLKEQHTKLESKIQKEGNRPQPNETLLNDMKKQKLKLKEELARLKK